MLFLLTRWTLLAGLKLKKCDHVVKVNEVYGSAEDTFAAAKSWQWFAFVNVTQYFPHGGNHGRSNLLEPFGLCSKNILESIFPRLFSRIMELSEFRVMYLVFDTLKHVKRDLPRFLLSLHFARLAQRLRFFVCLRYGVSIRPPRAMLQCLGYMSNPIKTCLLWTSSVNMSATRQFAVKELLRELQGDDLHLLVQPRKYAPY
jgi:hypothetical protein